VRLLAVAIVLSAIGARAGEPIDPAAVVRAAAGRYELGDYEGVVLALRPLVDADAPGLPKADRVEALRNYGIACVLTGRRVDAEGAFLLLLRADPRSELDPTLVRPEAATFFVAVRERYRTELVNAYRKNRGRRYAFLNLLPPVGQFMNHQRTKGSLLLAGELALLATNLVSGGLLNQWQGPHHLFTGHESAARALGPVNIASFALLLGVVAYGIIDGFVVGHRLTLDERQKEKKLLLSLEDGSLGVRF
jgi:hypothetical protein